MVVAAVILLGLFLVLFCCIVFVLVFPARSDWKLRLSGTLVTFGITFPTHRRRKRELWQSGQRQAATNHNFRDMPLPGLMLFVLRKPLLPYMTVKPLEAVVKEVLLSVPSHPEQGFTQPG